MDDKHTRKKNCMRCMHWFRCAAARHLYRNDGRYAKTIQNAAWRDAVRRAGYDIKVEILRLKKVQRNDSRLVRREAVDGGD